MNPLGLAAELARLRQQVVDLVVQLERSRSQLEKARGELESHGPWDLESPVFVDMGGAIAIDGEVRSA